MRSPIILIIFWVVISIIRGAEKNKKKQQRRSNIPKKPLQEVKPPIQNTRQLTERRDFRTMAKDKTEQVFAKKEKPKKIDNRLKKQKVYKSAYEKPEREKWGDEVFQDVNTKEELKVVAVQTAEDVKRSSLSINFHNDIVKGIIYKEILDKPKSLRANK